MNSSLAGKVFRVELREHVYTFIELKPGDVFIDSLGEGLYMKIRAIRECVKDEAVSLWTGRVKKFDLGARVTPLGQIGPYYIEDKG